jgi:hypothetical protein
MPTKPTAMPSDPRAPKTAAAALHPKVSSHEALPSAAPSAPSDADKQRLGAALDATKAIGSPLPLHPGWGSMWSGPQQLTSLLGSYTTRHFHNHMAAATVCNPASDQHIWIELINLQQAVAQRWMQQQMDGLKGMFTLFQERGQLKKANTLSKWFEQEYNWSANLQALIASQTTHMVSLMENIQVDYGYWVAQKTAQATEH